MSSSSSSSSDKIKVEPKYTPLPDLFQKIYKEICRKQHKQVEDLESEGISPYDPKLQSAVIQFQLCYNNSVLNDSIQSKVQAQIESDQLNNIPSDPKILNQENVKINLFDIYERCLKKYNEEPRTCNKLLQDFTIRTRQEIDRRLFTDKELVKELAPCVNPLRTAEQCAVSEGSRDAPKCSGFFKEGFRCITTRVCQIELDEYVSCQQRQVNLSNGKNLSKQEINQKCIILEDKLNFCFSKHFEFTTYLSEFARTRQLIAEKQKKTFENAENTVISKNLHSNEDEE